jgi:hypothetical protein
MSSGTARRWCYTVYAQDDDLSAFDDFEKKLRNRPDFRGLCHQLEQCPDTGRLHLQGYVEFNKPTRLASLKLLHSSAHWEQAKGRRDQCVAYCTKQESRYVEEGREVSICDEVLLTSATQGKRNDLLIVAQGITKGEVSRDDVFSDRPDLIVKFSRGINELFLWKESRERTRDRELSVEVLWGDAGVGKTRYAYNSSESVFILENSNGNTIWWDNYRGESTLIIDDFYGWIPHNQLLRFLDRYPCRLDVKGTTTFANWTKVYITSNRHPSTWYHKFQWTEDKALQRRINFIFECRSTIFGTEWKCEKTQTVRTFDKDFKCQEYHPDNSVSLENSFI